MSPGTSPNLLFVALGTLKLLASAAAGDPLVLLADDAQMLVSDDEAEQQFEAAVNVELACWPSFRARAQLAYGAAEACSPGCGGDVLVEVEEVGRVVAPLDL